MSLTITSVIMVGLSVFFASSFHNVFQVQERLNETSGQFIVSENIRSKLADMESVVEFATDEIVIRNKITRKQMPFSYIKKNSDDKLAFKDFFVFNDVDIYDTNKYIYGSSGEGKIKGSVAVNNLDKNFAGFAKIGSDYYVAYPLENVIKKCDGSSCTTLTLSETLDNPIDVETDGTNLYISDAGNDRILKITGPDTGSPVVTIMADEDLKFPTGLAYYNNGSEEFLFIADTYNNVIKRITPGLTNNAVTVAGNGTDTACNNTAIYCQLNFPTGLYVNSTNHTLYVSDSGSNRILKISDPSPDLNNYLIDFTLDTNTKISQINFGFPVGAGGITVNGNDLHAGRYDDIGNIKAYLLSTPILNGDPTRKVCSGEPATCTTYFDRFMVDANNQIFVNGDDLDIDGDTSFAVVGAPDTRVNVTPNNTNTTGFPPGTIVKVDNVFDAGDYQFDFDLSSAIFSESYNNITVELFAGDGSPILPITTQILRTGNGILGTPEDTIEVLYTDLDGVDFPTGIGVVDQTTDVYFYVNTGTEELVNSSTGTTTIDIFDESTINAFDYTSDFEIDSLGFQVLDAGSGSDNVLETTITTDTETYKINSDI